MSLYGHIALITGAGQGIGKACAFALAERGAELILWDKNPQTLGAVVRELKQAGRKVAHHVVDLTDIEKLRHAAFEAKKTGLVDILVNNAGGKGEVAYSTAKAGIIGLTKSVAKECGKDGVTVNAVLPGLIRTPTIEAFMAEKYKQEIIANTPLGRMAEPEEVAGVLAFLASDDASFITGAAVPVSGGWAI
jgi:NAD(P)-dependent dehydrogenase (short-subunit alcohol dehydrogenase family)